MVHTLVKRAIEAVKLSCDTRAVIIRWIEELAVHAVDAANKRERFIQKKRESSMREKQRVKAEEEGEALGESRRGSNLRNGTHTPLWRS